MELFKKLSLYIKKVVNLDLVKVFSFSAISTLVKMLTGFISVKIVAVIIGPSGIALLGQLNSFSTIGMTLASGGLSSGITKYISEFKSSSIKLKLFISTGFSITIIMSFLCGTCLIVFSHIISQRILFDEKYSFIISIFGYSIIFYALNNFLLSILNGFRDYKRFLFIGIFGSIFGLIFMIILVHLFGLNGAMIATVTYQSLMVFITIFFLFKQFWFKWKFFLAGFSRTIFGKYLHYSLMTFVNVGTIPISQLIIRSFAIKHLSAEKAGIWEAMNRISGMYLMVFTSSFVVYYLPRLSEIKNHQELRDEVLAAFRFLVPILIISFLLIYLFRHFIVHLLFSNSFYEVENLFLWQLIGDFFKMTSWILTFVMLAKSKTLLYISTEVLCYSVLTILSLFFIVISGLEGIVQAYTINYVLYFLMVIVIFRKLLMKS